MGPVAQALMALSKCKQTGSGQHVTITATCCQMFVRLWIVHYLPVDFNLALQPITAMT